MTKYVSVDLISDNVSYKITNYLYGLPGPLVFHSLLKALDLKLGNSIKVGNPMITYKEVREKEGFSLKSKDYKNANALNVNGNIYKGETTLIDTPEGYVKVNLLFTINTRENEEEKILSKLSFNFKKLRLAGGTLFIENLRVKDDIEDFMTPIGFTLNSGDYEFEDIEDFIFDNCVKYKNKKGLSLMAQTGVSHIGKAKKEDSIFKKEHYFSEVIIEKIIAKRLLYRKMSKEILNNYIWKTELRDNSLIIKTKEKG